MPRTNARSRASSTTRSRRADKRRRRPARSNDRWGWRSLINPVPFERAIGADGVANYNAKLRPTTLSPKRAVKRPQLQTRDRLFWVFLATRWREWRTCPPQECKVGNGSAKAADHLFRDIVYATAAVTLTETEIVVRFQKRAHNPLLLDAGFEGSAFPIPWLGGCRESRRETRPS